MSLSHRTQGGFCLQQSSWIAQSEFKISGYKSEWIAHSYVFLVGINRVGMVPHWTILEGSRLRHGLYVCFVHQPQDVCEHETMNVAVGEHAMQLLYGATMIEPAYILLICTRPG